MYVKIDFIILAPTEAAARATKPGGNRTITTARLVGGKGGKRSTRGKRPERVLLHAHNRGYREQIESKMPPWKQIASSTEALNQAWFRKRPVATTRREMKTP